MADPNQYCLDKPSGYNNSYCFNNDCHSGPNRNAPRKYFHEDGSGRDISLYNAHNNTSTLFMCY